MMHLSVGALEIKHFHDAIYLFILYYATPTQTAAITKDGQREIERVSSV